MRYLRALIAALCPFAIPGTLSAQASPPATTGVEITHLANEGFLIAAGETKVLVDALFGDGIAGYAVVPPEPRRRLEAASDRFAGVDLVLASHYHGDHFEAQAVARHLASNPGARFVSTRQAIDQLRRVAGYDGFADRVEGHWPAEGTTVKVEHAGVTVTVLNLHHGRDRRPPVQNLGFLIDLGGVRLLHVGDTEVTVEEVRAYALGDAGIDVLFAPGWFFGYRQWKPLLAEIDADSTVVMHLAEASAPANYFGPAGSRAKRVERILDQDPEAIILESMETRHFRPE